MNDFITKERLFELLELRGYKNILDYFNDKFPFGGNLRDILEQVKNDRERHAPWLFVNLKLSGLCEQFSMNGKLWFRGNYTDGKQNGLCERFYYEGNIKTRVNYTDGKQNGLCEEFHENGKIKFRGNYIDGEKID